MARTLTMGADWNAMRPWVGGRSHRLWSRFPVEIRPDTILTPLLFLEGSARSASLRHDACTLSPGGLVVMHGRGERQVRFLRDEVAPLLGSVAFAFVLDADSRTLFPARDRHVSLGIAELPSIVRSAVLRFAAEGYADVIDALVEEQASAFAALPTREEVDSYLAEPETVARVAEAAARAEAAPLRLWEAMLWRGTNYRWELVAGEVPLVGELWSELAANRTLLQCVEDAEHAFAARASEERGWIHCGPIRMRQTGSQVEIRFRLSPADRRAAFLPHARIAGEDALPSLWGALIAGGDKGKTEMIEGFSDSVIEVHPSLTAEAVARHLAAEIGRSVGAEVIVSGETADGGPAWPSGPGSEWHVQYWKRYVSVLMPMGRDGHLPWDIQSGLHLSDDFLLSRFSRRQLAR